ncbi:MAG: hypothetical protein KF798_04295 [Candidatus Paracaedibacteraceae bacterium]|nr:hypothetical protein [Candidatus Paracaedibacteraceae bacterium]
MRTLLSILSLASLCTAQDLDEKLKQYGIPSRIQTGFGSVQEMQREFRGTQPEDQELNVSDLIQELSNEEPQTQEESALAQIKHLVPEHVYQNIPANFILKAQLSPHDSPYFQAFKLERLGLIIKDIPANSLSANAISLRKVLMAHCFLVAGNKLEKALDQQVRVSRNIAPELLMDGYMSAGQFYYWAAVNMNETARNLAMTFARRSFDKTRQSIERIPQENYEWDVIGTKTLREVIALNEAKIEEYLQA